ncbi:response regulator [Clostridium frigoris]|uniref:Response regulator n=1 Tax=Clostridium frigoris TaxID=205327 RepID=A0ABS6BU94_9CLOT|nr:response regulator [Clostridium frigoris]MBU3160486.1 response regulator [Clostridium frigoris]
MNKVLVVDDTKNIRMLLTTCLELKGYKVLTAEDGKSAIDKVRKEKENIDIIFLDIRMPEMSGTEVLKTIREIGVTCPVIIMTAYATVKNAIDCTKLGAVAYLQKPFSPDRVGAVLDEILNSKEIFDEKLKHLDEESILILKSKELLAKDNFEEAHNILKKALAINPYNKEIYHLISEINKNINKLDKAKLFNDIYELFNEAHI